MCAPMPCNADKGLLLPNVMPLSLGIETLGGVFTWGPHQQVGLG